MVCQDGTENLRLRMEQCKEGRAVSDLPLKRDDVRYEVVTLVEVDVNRTQSFLHLVPSPDDGGVPQIERGHTRRPDDQPPAATAPIRFISPKRWLYTASKDDEHLVMVVVGRRWCSVCHPPC